MFPKKVLVGCPTYDGHERCMDRFIESIKSLSNNDFGVLFVDNSKTDAYANKIGLRGFEVIRMVPVENRVQNILLNRNKIIEHAIQKKYDYLFFVDTDVLIPEDALEKLLLLNVPIATGVYLGGLKTNNGGVVIAPVLYDFSDDEEYIKMVPMNTVLDDAVFEVAACGFGCCLIKREVFEKVSLRLSEKSGSGEDVLFCHDARKNFGFQTFVDTSIRCTHMAPDGDITFPAGVAHFSFGYDFG